MVESFLRHGWVRFPYDPVIAAWAAEALPLCQRAMQDPAHAQWWECGDTWFIGLEALDNDPSGALPGGTPLAGAPLDFISDHIDRPPPLHRAQLSVIRPGYPRPRKGENEAAFGYRLKRDAAHVDGVKLIGSKRRRAVEEPHAWVLGLPLNTTSPDAAPLVVWEGSHTIMRAAFARRLADRDPREWSSVDVTDAYTRARREVFDSCKRVELHAHPGGSFLLHRLTLHGIAPWGQDAKAPQEGRMIAYFRPTLAPPGRWLTDP